MANMGKTQLLITWVARPDNVSEVDRLVESHGSFMAKTHAEDGSNALLSYRVVNLIRLHAPDAAIASNSDGGNSYEAVVASSA
jgi:hypothetical protein